MCGGANFKAVSLPLDSFHQNIEPKEVDKNSLDLIIVGSGPAGLNSALQAKKRSLNYLLLEAGKLGQGIILNPASFFYPKYNGYSAPLKGDLWFQSASKDLLLHKWQEQARNLLVSENEPVIDVRQNHDGYWVVSNQKKYLTKYIVLATGLRKFFFR
jgi:thioredoxin reductase (NADPH)